MQYIQIKYMKFAAVSCSLWEPFQNTGGCPASTLEHFQILTPSCPKRSKTHTELDLCNTFKSSTSNLPSLMLIYTKCNVKYPAFQILTMNPFRLCRVWAKIAIMCCYDYMMVIYDKMD